MDTSWLTLRFIHNTKNRFLQELNEKIRDMIPGLYMTYLSTNSVEDENENSMWHPLETLNTTDAGAHFRITN